MAMGRNSISHRQNKQLKATACEEGDTQLEKEAAVQTKAQAVPRLGCGRLKC